MFRSSGGRAGSIVVAVALALAAIVGAGAPGAAVGASLQEPPGCESFEPARVAFGEPVVIDATRAGGEPVSVTAQDGSLNVSAHAGTTHIYKDPTAAPGYGDFLVGYTNQTLNWRSEDGGQTWQYIGFAGTGAGPHSATSTGFSDPDFAMDQAGNLYNTEIDLANVSVFKSEDQGRSYPIANPAVGAGDRPWLTALEPDEVFLYINNPKDMKRSTDPLLVQWETLPTPPIDSKAVPDPLNPNNGLIGPTGLGGFAISSDDAKTWEKKDLGPLGRSMQFFGVVATDTAGNVYQAAAGGYKGSGDDDANGEVTFAFHERATGRVNTEKISLPIPEGDALWPWVIAGSDGRVAVVWYQNHKGNPREFFIYAGITNNGHGTTLKCADGTTKYVPPQFDVVNVSKRPIHRGDICLEGTACNAATTFEGGDRRLGDFFSVNYDLAGNIYIASADTTLQNPLEGPKPVGNPIFIKQTGGERLLETPITPKPPITGGDTQAPSISRPAVSPRKFRARKGATVRTRLSEAAKVTYGFAAERPGRKASRGRCLAPKGKVRKRDRCVRLVSVASVTRQHAPGATKLRIGPKVGRRKLTPGRYRLTISAVDAAGNRSRYVQLRFVVKR